MANRKLQSKNTATHPALGRCGMVSSAHPLATQAGLDILLFGGNAFDAAVAVAATLNVVEPMMSGIGGYGLIILYDSQRDESWFLNCSGRIPFALDSDVFRPPTPHYLENRRGAKSASTPGILNAWEAMSTRYGKLEWRHLLQAAIEAADNGFIISPRAARFIASEFFSFPAHAQSIYGRNGKPLRAGQRLIQKDLASSLGLIAEQGAKALYGGELGRAVDVAMREADGFLSIDDLSRDRPEWWRPISVDYKGYEIVTASPPANSFAMLVRLGIMSCFDLAALSHNTTAYLHRYAEVTKQGYWARLRYAGDPEVKTPPLDLLLSERYWIDKAATIDLHRAVPFEAPKVRSNQGDHTTHFVIGDRWGNVVSATLTIGDLFGCHIMPKGTGFWLNNSLQYCTFEPKGNPMDAFPGRHKLTSDCPTLVMRHGKPLVAIGTPGGRNVLQIIPQVIMNIVDFNMDIQQAIAAPRISFSEPDAIVVEEGIPESIRDELAVMGHNIQVVDELGNAHGLTVEYDSDGEPTLFTGGADPRGVGVASGY
jgi:gamma-glutamyltranspeptidase/glutathione hydrolase